MFKHRFALPLMLLIIAAAFTVPLYLCGEDPAPTQTQAQTTQQATAPAKAENTDTAVKDTAAKDTAKSGSEQKKDTPKVEEKKLSRFVGTFWALVPPLLAIILALITKEVYSSLFIGVLLGGALVAGFAPVWTVEAVVRCGFIDAVKEGAGIFIFLVMLGIVVALINKTGATAAFGKWAQTHVKSRVGAILCTFLLGVLIFIDDYFNCLTVGSVMQPVTDAKRISRAKLAYIIDATAAPICMIAPISSWAAAVSEYADGTQYSGLEMFIRAIPYNFYSLLTFVFIIGITLMKIDFGPMALHEKNALEKGDLFTSGGEVDNGVRAEQNERGKVLDMLIPVILLIGFSIFTLVYVGGILDGKDFVTAFSDTNANLALPMGALIVLILSVIYLACRKVIKLKDAMDCIPKGFIAMVPAILILTFAMALKNMTELLEAKEFIGSVMEGSAASLYQFLPAVIFLVACVLAFSTGTSWGTFGILIPIVVGIFPVESPLLFIGMSACLAGAVCGDHCSPISDTTIMASAGARCNHINHVSTQLPYVLTVAGVSFLGFVLAGVIQNWFIVFPVTVAMMIGLLIFFKTFAVAKSVNSKKKEAKEA